MYFLLGCVHLLFPAHSGRHLINHGCGTVQTDRSPTPKNRAIAVSTDSCCRFHSIRAGIGPHECSICLFLLFVKRNT
ncbi:hypothetical protein PF011_g28281 [Phytophthora fragariae]|uniref:Secreted protein n=1 Tax=Phytophthora fragariae TaxID=53985 RepID=A0A6A3H8I1_9STRA|nr:hypothetical protein PF011_g28281 [Phytophthora fragariae]